VTRFSAKIGHMRADRLVAMLLVLQARGRVTATELATELEVSVKTARRDLEALAIAGIPVYSQPGCNGGWQLIGGARTDLSGLTEAEAKTLFMVAGPASTATPEAKAALRKLVRALPETFRADAAAAANSMVLDPASWGTEVTTRPAFLDGLRRAVVAGVQVRLGYADRTRTETSRVVHPLGLVEKGSTWYLVADTENGLRTFRVNRVRSVELTGERVVRPPDFDLAEAWREIVDTVEQKRAVVKAVVRLDRRGYDGLRGGFGPTTRIIAEVPPDGSGVAKVDVEVASASAWLIAQNLAGWADYVEVLSPPEVRDRLADIGRALTARYAS
jgi:predicted DNA-binding transcriptional regulator YafY